MSLSYPVVLGDHLHLLNYCTMVVKPSHTKTDFMSVSFMYLGASVVNKCSLKPRCINTALPMNILLVFHGTAEDKLFLCMQ